MRAGTYQPREEKPQGDFINVHQYLKGVNEDEGARSSSAVTSDQTRGNGHKLKHGRFCLNIMKHLFPVRVIKQWDRLPREVVDSPTLEMFQSHMVIVLGNWLQMTLLEQGDWTR